MLTLQRGSTKMDIDKMFDRSVEPLQDKLDESLLAPFEGPDTSMSMSSIGKLLKKSNLNEKTDYAPVKISNNEAKIKEGYHNGKEGFWVFVEADAAAAAAINLINRKKSSSEDSDEKKELDAKKKAIQKGIDPNAALSEKKWNFRDVLNETSAWKGFDNELDIEESESEEDEDLDGLMGEQSDDYADNGINYQARGKADRAEHNLNSDGEGEIKSNKKEEQAKDFLTVYNHLTEGRNVFSKNELTFVFKEVKESYTGKTTFKKHCLIELKPILEMM